MLDMHTSCLHMLGYAYTRQDIEVTALSILSALHDVMASPIGCRICMGPLEQNPETFNAPPLPASGALHASRGLAWLPPSLSLTKSG